MSVLGLKLRRLGGGRVAFWCPGCNQAHTVGVEPPEPYRWGFNGNGDRPTFTPSVLVQFYKPDFDDGWAEWFKAHPEAKRIPGHDAVCHSFVTDGRIQFLTDCTHALAGQTVDLPDFPGAQDE